jgi:transposase-like protein/DNA-directed RNA polymerase subunit RPC12/RpoP
MKTSLLPTPEGLSLPQIMERFSTEEKAIEYFEAIRWTDGIVCPHCGNNDQAKFWAIKGDTAKRIRAGLRQCAECKKQFRVTVGTIFEDSHVPLNLWLVAWYLICGAKKGMSALQLKRHLWGDNRGSYKTAWFMAHRIRHALQDPVFKKKLAGTVEVDETYVGGKQTGVGSGRKDNKTPVVSLVERNGNKRSIVMNRVTAKGLRESIREHVAPQSTICTDDSNLYTNPGWEFHHYPVNHSKKEYARKVNEKFTAHSNTVESSFSLLKRGVVGSFHHVSKQHLPLYCAEFDFRWNHRNITDGARTVEGLKKTIGKRLTYKPLTK